MMRWNLVRAINLDGSVGTSNLVRIKIDKAAGYVLRHTTQPGDTWESLTQSCDTSVETIAGEILMHSRVQQLAGILEEIA